MTKVTQVQKLDAFLQYRGFNIHDTLREISLSPTYYKDENGNHVLISAIHVCIFGGKGTKQGDLGCITFSYHGKMKYKGKRYVITDPQLFKVAFVPKDAYEAIERYELWHIEAQKAVSEWKQIL